MVVAGAGFGSYWFQPWKLWQDETVREALPTAAPLQRSGIRAGLHLDLLALDPGAGSADAGEWRADQSRARHLGHGEARTAARWVPGRQP
ncbi:hypothetical protein GCM10010294_27860 [Streptomyces griseoloalbus]|nr:hypothetical protein GCM10010294_27860 [Streptomyces griseoloalbus]